MTASVCQLRPRSRGTTHISGTKAKTIPQQLTPATSLIHTTKMWCKAIDKTRVDGSPISRGIFTKRSISRGGRKRRRRNSLRPVMTSRRRSFTRSVPPRWVPTPTRWRWSQTARGSRYQWALYRRRLDYADDNQRQYPRPAVMIAERLADWLTS